MAKLKSKLAYLLAMFVPVSFAQGRWTMEALNAGSKETASEVCIRLLKAGAIAAAVAAAAANS